MENAAGMMFYNYEAEGILQSVKAFEKYASVNNAESWIVK